MELEKSLLCLQELNPATRFQSTAVHAVAVCSTLSSIPHQSFTNNFISSDSKLPKSATCLARSSFSLSSWQEEMKSYFVKSKVPWFYPPAHYLQRNSKYSSPYPVLKYLNFVSFLKMGDQDSLSHTRKYEIKLRSFNPQVTNVIYIWSTYS